MPSLASLSRAEAVISEVTQLLFAEHHQRAYQHRVDVALFACCAFEGLVYQLDLPKVCVKKMFNILHYLK